MSGRGGTRRRGNRHRDPEPGQEHAKPGKKAVSDRGEGVFYERLRWIPPILPTEPLPAPDCPYCGKPIKDLAAAVTDKNAARPVHFDCIIASIAAEETLEKGDSIAYLGGGCFGVVRLTGSPHAPRFKIKKVVEWEDREHRAEWRKTISDRYSTT